MTAKLNPKKAKAATPKAPPVVYVEIDESDSPVLVNENPNDAEDERCIDGRLARYKFDCFVEVEYKAVVTPG